MEIYTEHISKSWTNIGDQRGGKEGKKDSEYNEIHHIYVVT
jgi:hypothetical protein